MNYVIINSRWAQDEVAASLEDIQEQAAVYDRDRRTDDEYIRCAVETTIRNGCDVVVDDRDEVVAVAISDYDAWMGME